MENPKSRKGLETAGSANFGDQKETFKVSSEEIKKIVGIYKGEFIKSQKKMNYNKPYNFYVIYSNTTKVRDLSLISNSQIPGL